MINIANPIYDVVFKYLLEDERIAKTLISALLKKEIVHLEQRHNEYIDKERIGLAILRIDFAATIIDSDGRQKEVLIELQKAASKGEIMRFRKYLSYQYASEENVIHNEKGEPTEKVLPIISIYLLGHRLKNIAEPVVYIKRHYYDYNDMLLTYDEPDDFIESLTHDSIIVQIPCLHGKTRNYLEQLLNVFDQTRRTNNTDQVLSVPDDLGNSNTDLQHVVDRLQKAVSTPEMRRKMDIEEEIWNELKEKYNTILGLKIQLDEAELQNKETMAKLDEAELQNKETMAKLDEAELQNKETMAKLDEAELQRKALEKENIANKETVLQMAKMLIKLGANKEEVARQYNIDPTQL